MEEIYVENYIHILIQAKRLSGLSCRQIGERITKPGTEETYSANAINSILNGGRNTCYLIHEIARVLGVRNKIFVEHQMDNELLN